MATVLRLSMTISGTVDSFELQRQPFLESMAAVLQMRTEQLDVIIASSSVHVTVRAAAESAQQASNAATSWEAASTSAVALTAQLGVRVVSFDPRPTITVETLVAPSPPPSTLPMAPVGPSDGIDGDGYAAGASADEQPTAFVDRIGSLGITVLVGGCIAVLAAVAAALVCRWRCRRQAWHQRRKAPTINRSLQIPAECAAIGIASCTAHPAASSQSSAVVQLHDLGKSPTAPWPASGLEPASAQKRVVGAVIVGDGHGDEQQSHMDGKITFV